MLEDSAKIQSIEIDRLKNKVNKFSPKNNKKEENLNRSKFSLGNYDKKRWRKNGKKSELNRLEVLYNLTDVEQTCALVKNDGYSYKTWIKLAKNINLKFYPSGHVLGGAICVLRIETKAKVIYLGFSGDLGRGDGIILPPLEIVEEPIDNWFIESTYGGKTHPPREEEISKLINLIKTAYLKKQKIIIPSFALERAQEIIFLLSYYIQTKQIPNIKIYLDSPMAIKITHIFGINWQAGLFLDQEKLTFNPFDTKENKFFNIVTDSKESEALISTAGPYIVIAGSGMCDAGRVREHLRAGLYQDKTTVCLIGYMAENSLGRKLKNGLPIVKMNGEEIIIKAKIVSFDSFSAHADSPYLIYYTQTVIKNNPNGLKKIFIIHGEEMSATCLKLALIDSISNEKLKQNIIIPKIGEEHILF